MRWTTAMALTTLLLCSLSGAAPPQNEEGPWEMRIAVVRYFPVSGDNIDIRKTGDWGETLAATQQKCDRLTRETIQALEQGSRFRGYNRPDARPSITYRIVRQFEFLEPLPVLPLRPGEKAPWTDYNAIMRRIDVRDLVEHQGVKEIWIWGYHGGVVNLWESNMSSPFGDVSNSNRDEKDLPVLSRTYTVYHYNYQRGTGEAVENHTHQIEALLNRVDGRDTTPPERWRELLFWGTFVGSDASHKIVTNPARCGWTHYAPNSERDYDWANRRYVETDIEDWKPDGLGTTKRMNCERWDCDGLKWKIFWMQSLPGMRNGLSYQGRPLRNWWLFTADWDRAMRMRMSLTR